MTNKNVNYKILQQVVDEETYRTDTSTLLAYDLSNEKFLFRALNSNYFLQDDSAENISVINMDEAEEIWNDMPEKYVVNITAAFPKNHGGVGMDTYTNLYDD
ncbi:MAG: hypothetical protein R8G33_03110 [Gammaproteobacteria bacterium]|nr:hypothetical protein [Gammaproteobacteria bacterium]